MLLLLASERLRRNLPLLAPLAQAAAELARRLLLLLALLLFSAGAIWNRSEDLREGALLGLVPPLLLLLLPGLVSSGSDSTPLLLLLLSDWRIELASEWEMGTVRLWGR